MSVTLERRTEIVTIYGGNYLAEIRHLERQAEALKEAEDDTPRTLAEHPEYLEVAQKHDDLVREAEASAVHVKVQALPRKTWKNLREAHPPRPMSNKVSKDLAEAERQLGISEDTFKDALVLFRDPQRPDVRTIIEPDMEPADLEEFLDDLSDADFDRIYITAFALNRARAEDPKASLVSQLTPTSSETSD